MKEKVFDATEYNSIKEIITHSCKKHKNEIAFVIKHKESDSIRYENITYEKFMKDINCLGTALYNIGMQNKRIAIVGKNRYEWMLVHVANLLRRNSICATR